MSTFTFSSPEDVQATNANIVFARGCWHDSHHGWRNNALAIIADALDAGFEFPPSLFTPDEVAAVSSWQAWEAWEEECPGSELLFWALEQAEDFLAELAPDGWVIGWNEGDFGMWREVTATDTDTE